MNQTDTNKRIAEKCGWRGISTIGAAHAAVGYAPWRSKSYAEIVAETPPDRLGEIPLDYLPNYTESLDAMHEAWSSLPPEAKQRFERELYCVVMGEHCRHFVMHQEPSVTNATAAQRAAAFLAVVEGRGE